MAVNIEACDYLFSMDDKQLDTVYDIIERHSIISRGRYGVLSITIRNGPPVKRAIVEDYSEDLDNNAVLFVSRNRKPLTEEEYRQEMVKDLAQEYWSGLEYYYHLFPPMVEASCVTTLEDFIDELNRSSPYYQALQVIFNAPNLMPWPLGNREEWSDGTHIKVDWPESGADSSSDESDGARSC